MPHNALLKAGTHGFALACHRAEADEDVLYTQKSFFFFFELCPEYLVLEWSHLVVTMVPRLCMDFLSPSVSITISSWSFSSGWHDKRKRASSISLSSSSRSTCRLATHASPARASSVWVQVDVMSPSPRTRLSIWACRT